MQVKEDTLFISLEPNQKYFSHPC